MHKPDKGDPKGSRSLHCASSAWRHQARLPGRAAILLKSNGRPGYVFNLWMKIGGRSMHENAGILRNFRLFGCVDLRLRSGAKQDHAGSVNT